VTVPVLELGGTHVTAALVEVDGACAVLRRHTLPLSGDSGAEDLLATIARCADAVAAPAGAVWAAAVPGPFDYATGLALFAGVGKFDALHGLRMGDELAARLEAAPSRIVFLNDAEAFAVGEYAAGAGRSHARMVGVTLGTGIGSAFLAGGAAVSSGDDVPPDGHVHRLTHEGRPIEESVSRRAILTAYARRSASSAGTPAVDVREIAAFARAGDAAATEVLADAFGALGQMLAPWLVRFRATCLVVGGSMTGSWDVIAPPLVAALRDGGAGDVGGTRLHVAVAQHPHDAALFGAARHAVRVMMETTT
jgi:glucokinase